MANRVKYYHVYGQTTGSDGRRHVVTIVGKFEQTREDVGVTEIVDVETKPTNFVKGELTYNVKMLKRKLTLGLSICHPSDTFDEEVGVEIAKSRIKRGDDLGSIETTNVTMLTEDAIMAELVVKLNHVLETIDEYMPIEE
jgi:hypothetical protein